MVGIVDFIFFVIGSLVELIIFALIANAIFSWLIAFEVVNPRNRFVYQVYRFLDAVTAPVLRPVRRFIPALGGIDISPVIVIIVLQGILIYLLPAAERALVSLLSAG
ncbi:MAG: YggT family protein [Caulobacterales bacterium]|jgi:YggT family protein